MKKQVIRLIRDKLKLKYDLPDMQVIKKFPNSVKKVVRDSIKKIPDLSVPIPEKDFLDYYKRPENDPEPSLDNIMFIYNALSVLTLANNYKTQIDILLDERTAKLCSTPITEDEFELQRDMPELFPYGVIILPKTHRFSSILFCSRKAMLDSPLGKEFKKALSKDLGYVGTPFKYLIVGQPANTSLPYFEMPCPYPSVNTMKKVKKNSKVDISFIDILVNTFYYISEKTKKIITYNKKEYFETFSVPQLRRGSIQIDLSSTIMLDGKDKEVNIYSGSQSTGRKNVRHVVMEHFRNQRYGPNNSKVKRIIIPWHIRGSVEPGAEKTQIYQT